jgi:hypothetical protein
MQATAVIKSLLLDKFGDTFFYPPQGILIRQHGFPRGIIACALIQFGGSQSTPLSTPAATSRSLRIFKQTG